MHACTSRSLTCSVLLPRLAVCARSANLGCTTCPEDLPGEHYYNGHSHNEGVTFNPADTTFDPSKCYMHKVRHVPIPVANQSASPMSAPSPASAAWIAKNLKSVTSLRAVMTSR